MGHQTFQGDFAHQGGEFQFRYDIAIYELNEEVDLKIYTPACLAKKGENFIGQTATAAGWGLTSDDPSAIKPCVPHEVQTLVRECSKPGRKGAPLVCYGDENGEGTRSVRI